MLNTLEYLEAACRLHPDAPHLSFNAVEPPDQVLVFIRVPVFGLAAGAYLTLFAFGHCFISLQLYTPGGYLKSITKPSACQEYSDQRIRYDFVSLFPVFPGRARGQNKTPPPAHAWPKAV